MSREIRGFDIIEKALKKAEKNGFEMPFYFENKSVAVETNKGRVVMYESLIFNHAFAKALFGVKDTCSCGYDLTVTHGTYPCEGHDVLEAWQYHLQQMVLEEDPIEYLAKFIE